MTEYNKRTAGRFGAWVPPMTDDETNDLHRRTFVKGAAATGVAATGITAFGGNAAAQNVQRLQLGDVQVGNGLVTVQLQNVRIIRDITLQDIDVTVIGGDVVGGDLTVDVIDDVNVDIDFDDRVINIQNVANDILQGSVIQVSVAVLGDAGNAFFGSTFDQL